MCDYMCGREATVTIGATNLCPVCNDAGKKIPFNEEILFNDAFKAYEHGYGILSVVSDAVKYKNIKAPAWFQPHEIRGKWKVLRI